MSVIALLRRSLSRGRPTALLLALVAGLAAAYLVASPRHAATAADAALGDAVSAAPAQGREIGLSVTPQSVDSAVVGVTRGPGAQPPFARVDTAVRQVLGPAVERLLAPATWAAQSDSLEVRRAGGAPVQPDGVRAVLRVQSGMTGRVRWVTGGEPSAPVGERTLETPQGPHRVGVVPVALAATTAERWGVRVGDELDLPPLGGGPPAAARLVGTFAPIDPTDGFWQVEPRTTGVASVATAQGGVVQEGALLTGTQSYGAVSDALWRLRPDRDDGSGSPGLVHTWRYPLAAERLTAADVAPLRAALTRLGTDPRLRTSLAQPLEVTTGLGDILDGYERSVATTSVLTSFAAVGVTALAVLVLALVAGVGVAGRADEIRLLRSRGASSVLVAGMLAAQVAVVVLPVGAVGVLLAVALVPGATPAVAWVGTAVVLGVPVVGVAAAGTLRVRAVDRPAPADGESGTVRAVRRVVVELAIVAVAVLAVTTVRARGDVIAGGTTDWYAALAPVLVALAVAVAVLRLAPVALRRLARVASRRRGLVAFVGLARAARTGATAVLPVAAVVVGAAVLGLVAATAAATGEQRTVSAYRAVGADARVDAPRVDPPDVAALRDRPGVRTAVPALTEPAATLRSGSRTTVVVLLAVDPRGYADVVRGTPVAVDLPSGDSGGAGLAAVTGPGVEVGADAQLTVEGITVPVRAAGTSSGLQRAVTGVARPVVLVPLDALTAAVPSVQPNTVYLAADTAAARDLAATSPIARVTPSGLASGVTTVEGTTEAVGGTALARLVAGTYLVAAVLTGLLTLLAVLLVLAATHEERRALVIRLRTMGLPHGRERGLAWTEVLPVIAVAALTGAAVGVAAPGLVGAAVDLTSVTGAASRPPLDPRPLVAVLAAAAVVALGALALLLDALAARRGALADHLRRGDTA